MKERVYVLHTLLEGFVHRRSEKVQKDTLPPKDEHVLLLRMSSIQRRLYKLHMSQLLLKKAVSNPLKAFAAGIKIWNHPDVLYGLQQRKDTGEAKDASIGLSDIAQAGPSGLPSSLARVSSFLEEIGSTEHTEAEGPSVEATHLFKGTIDH